MDAIDRLSRNVADVVCERYDDWSKETDLLYRIIHLHLAPLRAVLGAAAGYIAEVDNPMSATDSVMRQQWRNKMREAIRALERSDRP